MAVGAVAAVTLATGAAVSEGLPGRGTKPGSIGPVTLVPPVSADRRMDRVLRRRARPVPPVPILMYHGVQAAPPGAPYPHLWVPRRRFAAQISMLHRRGYHAVTMRALADAWAGRRALPRKPIVLTFDDGYRSDATVAMPLLRRLHWPGVLYLEAGALKTRGAQGMSRRAVRAVLRNGWELGSHTIDHVDVSTLGPRRLRYEIGYSRRLFQRMFGVRIESFCYPGGSFDHAAVREVQRAGYSTATTVKEGLGTRRRRYTLRRIRVDGGDTAAELAALLPRDRAARARPRSR
jgi:peptidoglycan/xylan/chitin deacetylase (PgdA/CDA1 family)